MRRSNDFMDRIKFSLLYRSSFSGVFKLLKLVITKIELIKRCVGLGQRQIPSPVFAPFQDGGYIYTHPEDAG